MTARFRLSSLHRLPALHRTHGMAGLARAKYWGGWDAASALAALPAWIHVCMQPGGKREEENCASHTSRKEGGRGEDGCGNVVTRRPDSWLGPVTPPHTTCVRTAHPHELELADLEYRASSDSTLFDSHQALPMLARSHAAVRSPKDCGTFRRYLFMHRQVQRPID